jgi:hypothetical protein
MSNTSKGRKTKNAKKCQQKQAETTSKDQIVTVHLPSHRPVQRTMKKSTAPDVVVPPPPLPQRIPVRLPAQGPVRSPLKEYTKFLNLPGEIRNKIYEYAFPTEFFEIRFADKGEGSLTYRLPHRPRYMQPRLEPDITRRRRLYDWPRRVRSKEFIPPYKLSPGPGALLLTCQKVYEEAAPLFYGNSTFTFQNLRAFERFMDTLSVRSKASIRSLHLTHHTAGNAFYTDYQSYTRKFDRKWDDLCWRASEEMKSLEELSIDLMINEVPISFDPFDTWMLALLSFEAIGLKRCSIVLHNHLTPKAVLEVEAYKIRRALLDDEFVEGWKGEAAWMRRQMVPKGGAKILRLIM